MQATVENTSNLGRRVRVTVPAKPMEEEVSQRLNRLMRTVKIAGFRPGKVPLSVVQKKYGGQVRQEVMQTTIERSFSEFIREQNLQLAGYPHIEGVQMADGAEQMEFVATFEVLPEVVIGDLTGVVIDQPVFNITQKEIDKTVQVLRKQRAHFQEVQRAAKLGDQISISFSSRMEGERVESTSGQEVSVILGDHAQVAEFDNHLLGMCAGGSKQFTVKYGEDSPYPALVDKEIEYEVTVIKVAEVILPEVNEDFIREFGVESGKIDDFYAETKETLQKEAEKRVRGRLKQQAMEALLGVGKVELPQSLMAMEMQSLSQTARAQFTQRQIPFSEADVVPGRFEEQARRNVGMHLIMGEVIKTHDLQPSQEQIRMMVEEISSGYDRPEDIKQWYFSDKRRMQEPVALATEANVVTWVLAQAKTREVPIEFEELMGGYV